MHHILKCVRLEPEVALEIVSQLLLGVGDSLLFEVCKDGSLHLAEGLEVGRLLVLQL